MKWKPPFFWWALLLGGIPAAVVLIFVQFTEDDMRILGMSLPGYGLASLFALSLSPIRPLLLLLGPALAFAVNAEGILRRWLTFLTIPIVLMLPLMLAAMVKGSAFHIDLLIASLLLCLSVTAFAAWFRILSKLPGQFATGLVLYGVFWSLSGLLHYVALYVAPYHDGSWLNYLVTVRYLLPQVGYAFEMLDEGLAGAGWPLLAWAPLFVQLPVLFTLDMFLPNPKEKNA
jgi:hypothetical protein